MLESSKLKENSFLFLNVIILACVVNFRLRSSKSKLADNSNRLLLDFCIDLRSSNLIDDVSRKKLF
jgi:hypothetical protein